MPLPERQDLLLGRAAFKLLAVDKARVIEHDLVSELGRPIGDRKRRAGSAAGAFPACRSSS